MQVRLLGPVELCDARGSVPIGPRARAVLAALALDAGRPVSVERLVATVWPEAPPATATTQIQGCVSSLRRAFGESRGLLVTSGPGYLLEMGEEEIDALGFGARVREARRAVRGGDDDSAARLLREALRGWRGSALDGVPGLHAEASVLEEQRLAAVEERITADLGRGRAAELLPELAALCADHPLRERFHAQLMVALTRSGRRPEALEAYQRIRCTLVTDLGLEPGSELQRLQRDVLAAAPVPESTLPQDVADFTGRIAETEMIVGVLAASSAPIVAISGRPGAGATSLAVHAAHRLRSRFPDGCLYADLHFTADPGEVLGRVLRFLGVPVPPRARAERAELYRARMNGRRILLVLNDAAAESQVLPLLPGAGGSAVVVTGRTRLTALPGALHLDLAPLPVSDALALLARIAGPGRIRTEPEAAARLVDLCDRLPLTVRAAGARLAGKPHWRIADLVARLSDDQHRLAELAHGDLDVRRGIAASLAGLSAPARTVFARLADGSFTREETDDLIEELVDARLLEAVRCDDSGRMRFRQPGLVRAFARGLSIRTEVGNATEEAGP
ncbi:AfsR/SARP family transcriptional regulator [Actinocorallia longicatena]|uniref:OmpR/PhoB-type domain-containing protein n=1 Tax=Actinocorallia longicatena TaxID=111803 RepID=A0ABP6Q465_9ACTN